MKRFTALLAALALAAGFTLTGARAADDPDVPLPTAKPATTHHRITARGKTFRYTATADFTVLRDDDQKPTAAMFAVAYTLDGADVTQRPVTFFWNGGPGSASDYLHMASFGPMRVVLGGTKPLTPPGHIVENDDTLLDATDLVFVDAPATGYSRIVGKAKKTDFFGIDEDAKAFQHFIEGWLREHGRYASPKFLFGESYGTSRAADVVNLLQQDGVGVNGVVLLSSILNHTEDDNESPLSDRGAISFVPTEAAIAWYHHAVPATDSLEDVIARARAFAAGPYATALLQGDALPDADRDRIAAQLHALVGLDTTYIVRANLRIDPTRFEKELLRERGEITGRYDARFLGEDTDRNADSPAFDPTLEDTRDDAIATAFNAYIRSDLHFVSDESYILSAGNDSWKFSREPSATVSFLPDLIPDLAQAMTRNPSLRVFSANGLFDLATPFFGTELDIKHLALPPSLRGHVTFGYYRSGHMVYFDDASRKQLHDDVAAFIAGAAPTAR